MFLKPEEVEESFVFDIFPEAPDVKDSRTSLVIYSITHPQLFFSQNMIYYLANGRGTLRNVAMSEVHETFNSNGRAFVGK